jgi:hypothetical protein
MTNADFWWFWDGLIFFLNKQKNIIVHKLHQAMTPNNVGVIHYEIPNV